MPACAEVSQLMQELTGTYHSNGEQNTHRDLSEAGQKRDRKDTGTILEFFEHHSPFGDLEDLYNIATGVGSTKTANPQDAEDVGKEIIGRMEGQDALQYSFRRKDQVETLGQKVAISASEKVSVDPQLLFQRLVVIANNSDTSLTDVFKYELSPHPPALFDKSGMFHEPNKPQLTEALAKMITKDELSTPPLDASFSIVDGGSLLQRLPWSRGESFQEIVGKYVSYLKRLTCPVVVFDGYANPSTKDVTHLRRSKSISGPRVHFNPETRLHSKKDVFLSNTKNKQDFITMLSSRLTSCGVKTIHAEGDADYLIAKTGVEYSMKGVTHVIGEDTDLLVLLCHHLKPGAKGLYLTSEKANSRFPVLNICLLKDKLGAQICQALLFIHAMSGCDTTSRLFGIGKGVALKKARNEKDFLKLAQVFSSNVDTGKVEDAGEKVLVLLYGGGKGDTLDLLRKKRFTSKVASRITSVDVRNLPPTCDSAKYHSLRVYHQVQTWMGRGNDFRAEEWGWTVKKDMFDPKDNGLVTSTRITHEGDTVSVQGTVRQQPM